MRDFVLSLVPGLVLAFTVSVIFLYGKLVENWVRRKWDETHGRGK